MRVLFTVVVTALIASSALVSSAFAAEYYSPQSELLFQHSEDVEVVDHTEAYNGAQATQHQVESYLLFGTVPVDIESALFQVFTTQQNAADLLTDLQLRVINTQSRQNRDLLELSAIELRGSDFDDGSPLTVVVLPTVDSNLVVVSKATAAELDTFLDGIASPIGFYDTQDHPFLTEIADVAERGIFSGYARTDGALPEFRPDQGINRAEFLKVVTLSAPGVTEDTVSTFFTTHQSRLEAVLNEKTQQPLIVFSDVDLGQWFAPYVYYAQSRGWIQGYPDGTFQPGGLVNLAEASKIVIETRVHGLPTGAGQWFDPYFQYLADLSIVQRVGDQYRFVFTTLPFYPYEPASRSQAAALLSRLLFVDDHQQFGLYGRIRDPETLPFLLPDVPDVTVLETGPHQFLESNTSTFAFFEALENNYPFHSIDVLTFSPENWKNFELSDLYGSGSLAEYLTETSDTVYVALPFCEGKGGCGDTDFMNALRSDFEVRDQDFVRFNDPNTPLVFSYDASWSPQLSQTQQTDTIIISSIPDQPLLEINFTSSAGGSVDSYRGLQPLGASKLGDQEWTLYYESNDGGRFSLVRSTDANDLVAVTFFGLNSLQDIPVSLLALIRSLSL